MLFEKKKRGKRNLVRLLFVFGVKYGNFISIFIFPTKTVICLLLAIFQQRKLDRRNSSSKLNLTLSHELDKFRQNCQNERRILLHQFHPFVYRK